MADQDQLTQLKQLDTTAWNKWRERHPYTEIDLEEADLQGANLTGAYLFDTNLIRAHLQGANLYGANLFRANLFRANLTDADLTRVHLQGANLTGANLTGANLIEANLTGANLTEARLAEARLAGTNLDRADLTDADLTETVLDSTTFGETDLSTAKGLDTIIHAAPSILGTNAIYCSKGNIPEIFLRGCGVPDDMIAYIRSIAGTIQYYTVFISYSSRDRDFTQRLYDNLQGKGIRCWFDQGSLKGGDPFWEIIDQAIIQYDKVIVALSEEAIQSPNVKREAGQALAKEQHLREQGAPKTVLFPITLDHAIEATTVPWATTIRQSRHILDFTTWKNEDSYQAAFTKLLSDLKTDE